MLKLRPVVYLLTALFLLDPGAAFAASESFPSPSTGFEVRFTEIAHRKFRKEEQKTLEDISHVVYRMDFFKKGATEPAASINFNDIYGWGEDSRPTPVRDLFKMMVWSPKEDFVILPDEGWASAPGTVAVKVVALNPELPWREGMFAFDRFIWTDDLSGIGDYHDDCDYGVAKFDGRTGKTVPVRKSESPLGYELISVDKDIVLMREVLDNCKTQERAPRCLALDLAAKKEKYVKCPAEGK